ncbi:MAG: M28 family peptidase [Flavobacteriales bacterium]
MRRLALFLPQALLAVLVHGQDRDQVVKQARAHLDTLTSEDFHGRGYVQGGDAKAAAYLAKHFKRIGLKPVKKDYYQPFTFNVNSFPDSIGVTVDGQVLRPGIDYLVDPASGSASGSYTLVHITPDDLLTPERRAMTMGVLTGNAACLHLPNTSKSDSLELFAAMARDLMHYGPVVKPTAGKLTWSVSAEALPFPLIEVSKTFVSDSAETIDLHVKNNLIVRHEAKNVLGMAKGKGKGWIIVGAHYDHLGRMGPDALFPGANDNASGVAMLLSLAEWFAKKPAKHNILFVAFAGEEAGLLGSEWCAVDRPIDMKEVRMMLNLDILGTGDDGIMVVNATANVKEFDRLVALNGSKNYLPDVRSRGPACNSDHCPFVKRGVPGIFVYTLGGVAHYHDVNDRAESLPLTKFGDLQALLKDYIIGMR